MEQELAQKDVFVREEIGLTFLDGQNDVYDRVIDSILKRTGIIKLRQLELCLMNYFGVTEDEAYRIIANSSRSGHVLLSRDGYALKKSYYVYISGDKFFDKISWKQTTKIDEDIGRYTDVIDQNILSAMWVVADKMPESYEFSTLGSSPWFVNFDTESTIDDDSNSRLYQITRIPANKEDARIEMLKRMPPIASKHTRKTITRIAFIENTDHVFKIPYIGIRFVVAVDENDPAGYVVLEDRGEDAWKDVREY